MLFDPAALYLLVAALAVDALLGDPEPVWRRVPHPVALFGRLVAALDTRLNLERRSEPWRRMTGCLACAILVAVAGGAGFAVQALAHELRFGPALTVIAAAILLAQRSLYQHVAQVRLAFAAGGLPAARRAVSMIVGRDPAQLDEAGICRAAVESCAENFSDGVVAPAFWFAVAGLPGIFIYKAVNTADSMIGHRTLRHTAFGWAAARLDDVLNFCPARLAALLIALVAPTVGGRIRDALAITWRDGRRHRSPNAGWPESAMAAALGVTLGGPRSYLGVPTPDPPLNAKGRAAAPDDIRRALRVLIAACLLHVLVYMALAVAI